MSSVHIEEGKNSTISPTQEYSQIDTPNKIKKGFKWIQPSNG